MEIKLPKEKNKVVAKNPKTIVLYGKPKVGKTTILAGLDNCLLIDLQHGSNYVEALKIQVDTLKELQEVRDKIKEAGNPYKYIGIDTITQLESMINPLAIYNYKQTPMGRNFHGDNIIKLPNGAGYLYIREAFFQVINWFKPLCEGLILIGHTKDAQINKDGKELTEMDLDLSGKLSRLVAGDADALGYVYREKNKTIISFEGGNDAVVEARPEHLKGKRIVVAESDDKGKLTTYMDRIFINNNKK